MITPSGVSVADFIAASMTDAASHARITFAGSSTVLGDDDIEASGITITSALNAETNLTIGQAVSREVKIPVLYSDRLDGLAWTSEFKLEYGIEINGNTVWVTLGYFTGKKPNQYISSRIIDFIAYDRMQKFDVLADDWFDSLTYPMTVGQMLNSLCAFCGVDKRAGDELPDILARSYSSAPITERGLTCRTVLSLIAESCGCYAKIDNEGYCKLVWFTDCTSEYELSGDQEFPPVEMYKRNVGKTWQDLEEYTWEELENTTWADFESTEDQFCIKSVCVKQTEDDIGVYYPRASNLNTYIIVDNPFLIANNQAEIYDYIAPIYTRLNSFGGYIPVRLTAIGCAIIEAGDIINITADEDIVRMPIFCKTMVWNGSLKDTLEATGENMGDALPSSVSRKLSEGGRYHRWKNTVDELYSELYDPVTGDVSVLQQTANALGLSASGIDIQGGKYVNISSGADLNIQGGDVNIYSGGNLRINSGGALDVDSNNFKISSSEKTLETGAWKLSEDGLKGTIIDGGYEKKFEIKLTGQSPTKQYQIAVRNAANGSGSSDVALNIIHGIRNSKDSLYLSPEPSSGLHMIGTETERWDTGYIDNVHYKYLWNESSRNVKHDIKPMKPVGEMLDRLKPVTFIYDADKNEKKRCGLIYEDTVEILPEICTEDESNKAVNYVELVPILLKEVIDLRARVKALEERNGEQ